MIIAVSVPASGHGGATRNQLWRTFFYIRTYIYIGGGNIRDSAMTGRRRKRE
jgi:hypothetical protein